MSVGRIAAAGAAALCVIYIRFSAPALYEAAVPAVRKTLGEDQVVLHLPEETLAWLLWDD